MTKQKHLKRRIRERMQKTGEAYTTARLHILGRLPNPTAEVTGATRHHSCHPGVLRLRLRLLRRPAVRPLSLRFVAPGFAILLCLIAGLTAVAIAPAEASTAINRSVRAAGRLP